MRILGCLLLALLTSVLAIQYLTIDGALGTVAAYAFPGKTVYAPNFSSEKFSAIRPGVTESRVLNDLGEPLQRVLVYDSARCHLVWLRAGEVESTYPAADCTIKAGETMESALKILGNPDSVRWLYSMSPNGGSYRERVIVFRDGSVVEKHASYYVD
jgi:hypothetical protein